MAENFRICKKCLIRDMADQAEYFKNMYEYIDNLEPEIKAQPELYENRLTVCKACDRLADGMCRGCGCFVEMRAAVRKNSCPYEKW